MTIEEKARKIKLLILDVDGIMTDGRIYYGNYGDEIKSFDVKDGFGIVLLMRAGIQTVILTAKKSKIVRLRAKDLGIKFVYENASKLKVFEKLLDKFGITSEEACFAGDDLIDIPILKRAGFALEFNMTDNEREAYNGVIAENINLINKI